MMVSMTYGQYLLLYCRIGNRLVKLTRLEAELLCYLLLGHPDRHCDPHYLVECLWPDPNCEPGDPLNNLRTYIQQLRDLGIVIEMLRSPRYTTMRYYNYGGYRIPAWARGRPERVKLAA